MSRYIEPTPLTEAEYPAALQRWRRNAIATIIAMLTLIALSAIPALHEDWTYRQHGVRTFATLISDDRYARGYNTVVTFQAGERTCSVSKITRIRMGVPVGGDIPATYLPGGCEFRLAWDDNTDLWALPMGAGLFAFWPILYAVTDRPVRPRKDRATNTDGTR